MAFVQTCVKCTKKISGEYRMVLMMGPKGYRHYAVHVTCQGKGARGKGVKGTKGTEGGV